MYEDPGASGTDAPNAGVPEFRTVKRKKQADINLR
jgi:hypothetical protein